MRGKDLFTEGDNTTGCAIRVLGFLGLGLVGVGVIIGSAPAEIGLGVAAIIGSVGGSIRLKGDGTKLVDTER